jgi:methyl-accepting chemotaxis protein
MRATLRRHRPFKLRPNRPNKVGRIHETINLLEVDLGAMIGAVHEACELVCHESAESATATDTITRKTDSLVSRAGTASRDLTQLSAPSSNLHSPPAAASKA